MTLEKVTKSLAAAIAQSAPRDGAEMLAPQDDETALAVLRAVPPDVAQGVLHHIRGKQRRRLLAAATRAEAQQWARSETYEEGTIGRMMESPTAIFAPDVTVESAIETIRELVKRAFVTYGFVVDADGRLATPWKRSLKFRHPWLQLNLLTAFLAAGVVGIFQGTIDRIVILAVFLPVLAGQSGNTGCQALAVALRGITLGELAPGRERALVLKEAFLGLMNGALVGLTAGIGMYVVATFQKNPASFRLGVIVLMAMTASCVISGISGALIPLTLRKLGADPATASSIFLTTATDVASMGLFLLLATVLIPA